MANRTQTKIINILFIGYLILFPLGQLLHGAYLSDLLVVLIGILVVFCQKEILNPKGKFVSLLLLGGFSLLASLAFFAPPVVLTGAMYFVRLVAYVLVFFFVRKTYSTKKSRTKLFKALLVINVCVIILGLAQYFFLPDLRFLKQIGWDDHYFRLVGTFLDPTFTGIILLVGLLLALSKKYYLLGLVNLIAIALTYSRSTYLALIISVVYFFLLTKRKILLLFPILLLVAIPFLPRPSSEGVKLERTYSVFQKFDDYRKALVVFTKSPVYGIGYNNICAVKQGLFNEQNPLSHSCSGLDNSLLLVLATMGILGLILLIEVLVKIPWKSTFGVVLVAVLVHAMFTNTLFYPFVMGLIAIIPAATKE